MNPENVFLNSSDIAAFIGQNKWDIVTPFERLWKKCDKSGYKNTSIVYTAFNTGWYLYVWS